MPKRLQYDAVVIGAGNGGLTAAATMCLLGMKPLVLEQHNLPGGFASSFIRGRFEFEPSLHELREIGTDDNKGEVRRLLESFGVDCTWYPVGEAYRVVIPGVLDEVMPFGKDAYIKRLEELVPGCRESVETYFALCEETVDAFNYVAESKGNADPQVLKKEYPNFLKTNPYALKEVLDAIHMPHKAQLIIGAYWCYLGLPMTKLSFSPFASMFYTFILRGAYLPEWRSHQYTADLDRCIRRMGGDVVYNTRATRILVENGEVRGVETDQGDIIETRHVVPNTSMHNVYGSMIDPEKLPQRALQYCNARKIGMSAMVVYCGLNKGVDELGIEDYSYFIYPDEDSEKTYDSFCRLDGDMGIAVTCLNKVIPHASPEGTTIFEITTLFDGDAWRDVKPEDYYRIKNEIGIGLVRQFERTTGIAIETYIEEFEVATPATFATYTGSYDGSIYGYQSPTWDSVMPRLMSIKQDAFIRGIEFTGGCAAKIHGYASSLLMGDTAGKLTWKAWKEEDRNNG